MSTYTLLAETTYSALSRPRKDLESSYKIYFVDAKDPAFIPDDFEAWPLYHQRILQILRKHPDVLREAVRATDELREELKGLENRDVPPGYNPIWNPPAPPPRRN
jgi:hypothetical protein